MDPVFLAYSCFRRRKFDDCVKLCTQVLEKNPYDQVNQPALSLYDGDVYFAFFISLFNVQDQISMMDRNHDDDEIMIKTNGI